MDVLDRGKREWWKWERCTSCPPLERPPALSHFLPRHVSLFSLTKRLSDDLCLFPSVTCLCFPLPVHEPNSFLFDLL
jgi:hypothetical protein